jgi:hypothetical protein
MIDPFVIILIPFIGGSIFTLKGYFSTRKILAMIKIIDYDKWLFLTSSSLPVIKHLFTENCLWVNSVRFNKFIKLGEYLNNPELEKQIKLCRRNMVMSYIFCALIVVIMILSPWLMTRYHQ